MTDASPPESGAMPLYIAVVQFAPTASIAQNLEAMRALVREAAESGARLVVFPEYSSYFTPKPDAGWVAAAENLDGVFVQGLGGIAEQFGVIVVAGMLETSTVANKCRNTIVAVGPDRRLLSASRKLHLYDAFGASESTWVEAGDIEPVELFDWDGMPVGVQTCYDLRFPEVTRRLVDAGAELVLVPAEWVAGPGKRHAWTTLATARALENTVYVAAADHPAPEGVGTSLVVGPGGETLAEINEHDSPAIAIAAIDREHLAATRRMNPALTLRRFGVAPR